MREAGTDVLVVGGGLGGVAAALAAVRLGRRVLLSEESDWIGGQLTAQAVPPDEHPWIESMGCTASYRRLRNGIRAYYREHYPLLSSVRSDPSFNPGEGTVSGLCHEPRVALAVLEQMLAPYRSSGRLRVLLRHRPVAAETDGDRIAAIVLEDRESGDRVAVDAPYVLDATELGNLVDLAGVEHVIGSESQRDTGEPHAVEGDPRPLDQQAVTWCFAMEHLAGENHTIEKPADYDFWRRYRADFWPGPHLGWVQINPQTLDPWDCPIFPRAEGGTSLWRFRRILYRGHYQDGAFASDVTLVNWPQNDYWLGPLLGVPEAEKRQNLEAARQLSLSLLYWLQTEAPRPDGGCGYPGLRLREDIVGTGDGLAKHVYVRESRRIRAELTVLEQHVGVEARPGRRGAEAFPDSVGIGSYRIDLHPSTGLRNYVDISSWPFQIPLGALLPVRVENLLPACKNLGVTHVTNGCYRLHPVEWNVGEAAGALAAYCLERGLRPRQVRATEDHLRGFQRVLADVLGVELAWPAPASTPR